MVSGKELKGRTLRGNKQAKAPKRKAQQDRKVGSTTAKTLTTLARPGRKPDFQRERRGNLELQRHAHDAQYYNAKEKKEQKGKTKKKKQKRKTETAGSPLLCKKKKK